MTLREVGRFVRHLFTRSSAQAAEGPAEARASDFRRRARSAAENGGRSSLAALLEEGHQRFDDDEIELELEMLHARLAVLDLDEALGTGVLPIVVTQHKAVANETCHFLAPVSLATDSGEWSGKLFVTARRLRVFGGRDVAIGWGVIRDVAVDGRNLIVASGNGNPHVFRCNSFSDAWVAAALARALMQRAREAPTRERDAQESLGHS
jgi:hypothetical protein